MGKASETGHWYTRDGLPCYEVPNASREGETRPVTLRDAKKLDLVPSVTTVMNILAKPGLEQWKQKQVLMAAMTLPAIPGESVDEYATRVMWDAAEQGNTAAERGTQIHAAIEKHFSWEPTDPEDQPYIDAAVNILNELGNYSWAAEKSFAAETGYGGKVDLHADGIVIDFKTKEFDADTPIKKMVWPEQCYQLAAYRHGLLMPQARCYNIFISVKNPGLAMVYEWPEDKLIQGFAVFTAALQCWKTIKGL